jgi:putative SOS response-associated peptidase YedK/DNA-binding response OmpR family regulator
MAQAQKKILCIEDDRETAKLIAEELSGRGFCPLIAYDGRVGLAAIQKRIPDLVLCDLNLPDMSGFEVLAHRNEMPPLGRVPFLFLTGATGRYSELQGRSLGADDYLAKPIDFDILEMIIRTRLAGGIARHAMANRRVTYGRTFDSDNTAPNVVEVMDAPLVHPDSPLEQEISGLDFDRSGRRRQAASRPSPSQGRFVQDYRWADIARLYGASGFDRGAISERHTSSMMGLIDAVHLDQGRRIIEPMRWGLIPNWWRLGIVPTNPAVFSASADIVATAPIFRSSFGKRHCLIPASGFYEFGDRRKRRYFSRSDGSLMTIAGLWDEWRNPDTGEMVRSCAALVRMPDRSTEGTSGSMPVMLEPEHFERWLSGQAPLEFIKSASLAGQSRYLIQRPTENV